MNISIDDVRQFFRDEEAMSSLSRYDREEIILACCGQSEKLYTAVEKVLEKFESEF